MGRGSACGISEEFFVAGIQGLLPGLSELLWHSIFLWYTTLGTVNTVTQTLSKVWVKLCITGGVWFLGEKGFCTGHNVSERLLRGVSG